MCWSVVYRLSHVPAHTLPITCLFFFFHSIIMFLTLFFFCLQFFITLTTFLPCLLHTAEPTRHWNLHGPGQKNVIYGQEIQCKEISSVTWMIKIWLTVKMYCSLSYYCHYNMNDEHECVFVPLLYLLGVHKPSMILLHAHFFKYYYYIHNTGIIYCTIEN